MGHLLAYKSGNSYHLARWNRETASAARHLGAGKVVLTLQRDAFKHFTFGSSVQSGSVPVAVGYTGAWSPAGEEAVANTLYTNVACGTSAWPYMGDEWASSNVEPPCFWHVSGGLGISRTTYVGSASESCMSILAKHFTLPASVLAAIQAGASISARVKVKGIGAWVQPNTRNTYRPVDCDVKTIEADPNWYGYNESSAWQRRIMFSTYNDSLSVGVHVFGGDCVKANFNPLQCFFAKSVCPTCGAVRWYDLRRLYISHHAKSGSYPTAQELGEYYGISMTDPANAHWVSWLWTGNRYGETAAERWAAQDWAMSNGGTVSNVPIFTGTGGTGWGPTYIAGSQYYPHDGSHYLFADHQLGADALTSLRNGGVWVIVTQLPNFASTTLSQADFDAHNPGRTHLPASAVSTAEGPCVNTLGSAQTEGKQLCTEILSVADCALEVTIE